jgi:hypothetical protein
MHADGGRDVARAGAVEALPAEQPRGCPDELAPAVAFVALVERLAVAEARRALTRLFSQSTCFA